MPTLLQPLLRGISVVQDEAHRLLWGRQELQTGWNPAPAEAVSHSNCPYEK